MKIDIIAKDGTKKGSKELPVQFGEAYRPDVIGRATETIANNSRQQYGADPRAGKRAVTEISRRRRKYKTSYGHGISRVPRKIMSKNGTRINWVGAFAPGTRKGRQAHPPKATKIWDMKLNDKERRLAIRSAMSAAMKKDIVELRGHRLPAHYPFLLEADVENMKKTKELQLMLEKLGFEAELERTKEPKMRAGISRRRGRQNKSKIGPVIVVSDTCSLLTRGQNIPGIEVVSVRNLNAKNLSPNYGGIRAALFTEKAIDEMEKKKMFM